MALRLVGTMVRQALLARMTSTSTLTVPWQHFSNTRTQLLLPLIGPNLSLAQATQSANSTYPRTVVASTVQLPLWIDHHRTIVPPHPRIAISHRN